MKGILTCLLGAIMLGILPTMARAQDDEKFSIVLMQAARKGDASAQNTLAIAYSEGAGIRPNQRLAVYWFRRSAEQGHVYGACNLGLHYAWGMGIHKNKTQALKWAFITNSLDGLRCQPADFIEAFEINQCQIEAAWALAIAWLRRHPKLENRNFGGRPWMDDEGEFGVTVRERGSVIELPIKQSGKCKRRE